MKSIIIALSLITFFCQTSAAQAVETSPKPLTLGEGRHVVSKKQTLYKISKKYHITLDKLKSMNNLTTETIEIGKELIVKPGIPVYYHIVEKGQTLYSISKLYKTDVKRLKKMNKLKSNNVKEGKELVVDISNSPL